MEEYFALDRDDWASGNGQGLFGSISKAGAKQGETLVSLFLVASTIIIAALLILWSAAVGNPVRPVQAAAMQKKVRASGWLPASVRPVEAIWIEPASSGPVRIVR
jgi:hypothetical protein